MASEADSKRWVCVYPIYINSKKTLAEGRKIPVAKACENPTLVELCDCLSYLKLNFRVEPEKTYSRDFTQRGRLKVQLKKDDGTPVNALIPTRKALLVKLGNLVPKHHGRTRKQQEPQSSQQTQTPASTTGASEKKGKSGKKKK